MLAVSWQDVGQCSGVLHQLPASSPGAARSCSPGQHSCTAPSLLSLGEKRLHADVGTAHSTSLFTLTRHYINKGFLPALTGSPHALESNRLTVRPCIPITLEEAKTKGKNTCREVNKEEEHLDEK